MFMLNSCRLVSVCGVAALLGLTLALICAACFEEFPLECFQAPVTLSIWQTSLEASLFVDVKLFQLSVLLYIASVLEVFHIIA